MKRKLALLLVLVMAFVLGSSALAVVKPGKDFYYLDTANVLSEEAEGTIYFCNQLLEEACGGQVVVAALDSIGSADIYEYSYELFNEWGIGSADEQNGFLLLMTVEEDNYYALSGGGVEGIFASSELNRLFDKYLEPDFAKKNYEAGALKFFEAVLEKYIDRYNLDFSYADGEKLAMEYLAGSGSTAAYGGAQSGGGAYSVNRDRSDYHPDHYEEEDDSVSWILVLIIIIVIISISRAGRRRRGGSSGPIIFFGPGPHRHHHAPRHRAAPPRTHNRRPPSSGFGGFDGGFGGGGRSGGGFGGSFGGGRGGGGGSFGGGAGRGRH